MTGWMSTSSGGKPVLRGDWPRLGIRGCNRILSRRSHQVNQDDPRLITNGLYYQTFLPQGY